MREHPTESNFEADAWSLNGDLFYRKEDKNPFQAAVRAVEREEKSLVVIGDEGVLDHYCRLLIGRLKDNERFHLEVFLSTSKDGLLKRFNQMLANMSIDEARKPANADTSVHLLVINDASAVKDQEWTLLIRLIRDFPGANVRVALFVDKSSLAEFENRFDKLGRRVHRWTVHAPTLEEVRQLRQIGKLKGYSAEVEKMLLIAGLDEQVGRPKEPIIAEPIIPGSLIEEPESVAQEIIEEVQVNAGDGKQERTGKVVVAPKWSLRRFLLLTLCLSASILLLNDRLPRTVEYGTTFWMDNYLSFMKQFNWLDNKKQKAISRDTEPLLSDAINSIESLNVSTEDQEPFEITMYFSMPITIQPAIKKVEAPASISVLLEKTRIGSLTQRETIVEKKGVKTIVVSSDDKRTMVKIVLERMVSHKIHSMGKYMTLQLEVPVEADDVVQLDASLQQEIIQNVVQEEASSLNEDEDFASEVSNNEPVLTTEDYGADLIREEEGLSVQRRSVQSVLAAEDGAFFLQHIVFTEESQARDYMNSYEGLENALLVPIRSGENQFLAVLSGPFDSNEEAESWAKELRLPADFWIRNAGLLKRVLAEN